MVIKKYISLILVLPLVFILSSCGGSDSKRIEILAEIVEANFKKIEDKLANDEFRNAVILKKYIYQTRNQFLQHAELLDLFAKDATKDNANLINYRKRFDAVVSDNISSADMAGLSKKKYKLQELTSLSKATDPDIFNDSLIDSVNFVADLNGSLPKFDGQSGNASAGSHLVGNPSYGQWQTDSSGTSFWAWYGMYSMMNGLTNRPYYYNRWYYDRPWSYYNDNGRRFYGSSRDRNSINRLNRVNDRKIKDYGRRTGRNQSSYGQKNNSGYKVSKASNNAMKSSRNSSGYGSSLRSSGRSGGGSFGGK